MPFLLFVPTGFPVEGTDREASEEAGEGASWPVIVFLHGAGERGDDLDLLTRHALPRLVLHEPDFPFLLVSPQAPEGTVWTKQLHLLGRLVDQILDLDGVDPTRIYLTGMSMGGYGAWALAARNPERYAALAPICGGGDPRWASRLVDLPIWAFHGADDPVVPVSETIRMVDAVKAAGGKPKLTIYEGVGHDAWTVAFRDAEFFDWLAEQRQG